MWCKLSEDIKISVLLGDEYVPIRCYGDIIIVDLPKNIAKDDFYIQLNSSKEKYVIFEFNNNSINLVGYNITFNGFKDNDDGSIKSFKLQYLNKLNLNEEQMMKVPFQISKIVMKIYNAERTYRNPTKTYIDGFSRGVDEVDAVHGSQGDIMMGDIIGFSTHQISNIHYEKTTVTRGEFLFEAALILNCPKIFSDKINIL